MAAITRTQGNKSRTNVLCLGNCLEILLYIIEGGTT